MKAIIFDRDGTLIKDYGYLDTPEKIEVLPGVFEGLKLLKKYKFVFFIITNQSGIGRGLFTIETLTQIHNALEKIFKNEKIKFQEILFCPHTPLENCSCRKPEIGLFKKLLKNYPEIELKNSYSIGDKDSDIEFGKRAKLNTIGVLETQNSFNIKPDYIAKDFKSACEWIVKREKC